MTCIHHWIMGDAGREVEGRCKHCGEARTFSGVAPYPESIGAINGRYFNRSLEKASALRRRGAANAQKTKKAAAE